jgi:hypothetical protein
MTIGTTMKKDCKFDLTKLANHQVINANIFYEMFLLDYDGTMHQVPVKITNYQEAELDNSSKDMNKWMLVKRFFVADSYGGISSSQADGVDGWQNKLVPEVIRYASSIKIKIQLDDT